MTDFFMVDPVKKYQINGEALKILPAVATCVVGTNKLVLAAITGKIIRVMGWNVSTAGAVGSFFLKSASGGTAITNVVDVPAATTGYNEFKPIVDSGYCETNVGEGLYADIFTTDIYLTIFYIAYTP